MRNLLGGKGANLAEMNLIGVPVPPGFTITTDVCTEYYEMGQEKVVSLLKEEVEKAIANIENLLRSKFGDVEKPVLASVRSGVKRRHRAATRKSLNSNARPPDWKTARPS